MRDILTILAGLVILVLAAALAVPPFVDWAAQRAWIDRTLSRGLGQDVRTDGALDLRLLPTPRIRMQRVRIGAVDPGSASLDAMYVRAEIALTPLLSGEIRILDTRVGRSEIKLPVGPAGDWRMPARLLSEAAERKGWALEDLRVEQFLVTTADPATGRTDQHYAENVRIQAGAPLGPWRLEGRSRGIPVDIAMGELGGDRTASLKMGIGTSGRGRVDLDGQLALVAAPGDVLQPRIAGTARWAFGTPETPAQAQATVRASSGIAELTELVIESGQGTGAIRLVGDGRVQLGRPALALRLAGRRVDLGGLRRMLAAAPGPAGWRAGPPLPLDLSLTLESLAVGGDEDLSRLSLALSAEGDRGALRSFEVAGPGRALLRANGSFWLGDAPGGAGHVSLEAADGQRLARSLESLGLPGLAGFAEPRMLEAAADVSLVDPVVSLRGLRIAQGDLRISGAVRHTAADAGNRPRLDAQLAVEGLDVATVPQGAPIFALARDRDLGLTIDARNVSHGGRKGGRVTGRISTEGSAIVVDALEVRNLAGAEATLSGRIAPDGAGRIEGRLKAPQAAPLLDLFGQAWIGGLARLVPAAARNDAIDLRVDVEQTGAPETGRSAIRTVLQGRLGDAPLEAVTSTSGGTLSSFMLKTDAGALSGVRLGQAPSVPSFTLTGERAADGRLTASAAGRIGGLAIETLAPLRFGAGDDRLESGEMSVAGQDAGPLLARLGIQASTPVPIALKMALSRKDDPTVMLTGEIARTKVAAELSGASPSELRGTVAVDELSLPWLASTLLLGAPTPGSGAVWPTARFGEQPSIPVAGSLAVRATALDLGLGIRGRDAGFTLSLGPSGLRLSRFDVRLGDARLRGELGLDRQGGLASLSGDAAIEGVPVAGFLGAPFSRGRLAAKLRYGASGESLAGLVGNIGGAGEVAIDGLSIDAADPAGPNRLAVRVLRTDDPLSSQRWQPLVTEELGRGPLAATAAVTAPGALVGGALRLSPLRIDAEAGTWQGAATLDLRNLSVDLRGALQSKALPRGWSGAPPTLGLGWSGPLGRIARAADPAPLVNGLATNVLARELDRIDLFDQDAAERRRRSGREDMDRQRKADEARRIEDGRRADEEARRRRESEGQDAPTPPLPPAAPRPAPAQPGG